MNSPMKPHLVKISWVLNSRKSIYSGYQRAGSLKQRKTHLEWGCRVGEPPAHGERVSREPSGAQGTKEAPEFDRGFQGG